MKKNLLYLLMLLAMPLTFVACSDDDDDVIIVDPTFTLDASGEYEGTASISTMGINTPITFTVDQQDDSTALSINGSVITVPSTATETLVELNGEELDATLTIGTLSLTVTSLTGTLNDDGEAEISLEAELTIFGQTQSLTIEITAKMKDDDYSDEDSSSEATVIDASGEYEGTIDITLFGQTLLNDSVSFTVEQGEESTILSIDSYIEGLGDTITLEVEIPSTASETTLELNGEDMGQEANIIGIDVVINSISGTFTAEGEGSFTIEAEAPALYQVVTITIEAQKK